MYARVRRVLIYIHHGGRACAHSGCPTSSLRAMGKDRKYQDRLEVVLRQLEEDLTIVHVSIEELQDKDYRRALRWSGSVIWRKADRHLSATLKRQELTLERFQHAVGSAGRDLDALVPMPGGVSRMRMTFAKRAESAWWSVRSQEHEVEELIGAVMKCAFLIPRSWPFLDMLTTLSASMATDILAWNDV